MRFILKSTFCRNESINNIVKFYQSFKSGNDYYILLEYCPNGSLADFIKNKYKNNDAGNVMNRMTLDEIRYFSASIVNGLEYLHNKGFIHRDIKPSNILIDDSNVLKICDFGTAKIVDCQDPKIIKMLSNRTQLEETDYSQNIRRPTFVGTNEYISPEVLNSQSPTPMVDIWGLGIMVYEMFCGKTPFAAATEMLTYTGILFHGSFKFTIKTCANSKCSNPLVGELKSKKTNKVRAKEHRERKKEFYSSLEKQVTELKEQIAKLEQENSELKDIISKNHINSSTQEIKETTEVLKEEEKYLYTNIAEKLKQSINDVKFTMLDQIYEKIGNSGTYRMKLIKICFRTIIDNIITQENKALIACMNSMSFPKLLNTIKSEPVFGTKPIKRFKSSEKTEIDIMISGVKFSDDIIDIYTKNQKEYLDYFKNLFSDSYKL